MCDLRLAGRSVAPPSGINAITPRGLRSIQAECDEADRFAEHIARQMSQIAAEIGVV